MSGDGLTERFADRLLDAGVAHDQAAARHLGAALADLVRIGGATEAECLDSIGRVSQARRFAAPFLGEVAR